MRRYIGVVTAAALACGLIGCDKFPFGQQAQKQPDRPKALAAVPADTVAVVGNAYISSAALRKAVELYNNLVAAQGMPQQKIDTKEKKVLFLRNSLVRKYMLYQEALDRGTDKKDDIAAELEAAKVDILSQAMVNEELSRIAVNDAEAQEFYNKNKEMMRDPERRGVLEIMTPSEDEAKQVNIQLLQNADFAALARQFSKAPSAASGGDLGLIALEFDPKKRVRFDKFYEVAFSPSLDAGGISSIFKGPDGYYIVKVEKIEKSEVKPFAEVKADIKEALLYDKRQEAITALADKLTGQIKVEVREEKVE
jgi:peptidyl-prolyl cis-trans isomerase C